MLKPFSGEKISVEMGPKNSGFGGKMGVETSDFGFVTPKRHSLRGTTSFDVFCVKIGARLGCSLSQVPKKVAESLFAPRGAKSRMRRTETPKPIWTKFW